MLYKKLSGQKSFVAGDRTILKELLHPARGNDGLPYSLAYAFLPKGEKSALHFLASTEVYFFLEGKGKMYVNEESVAVEKGDYLLVPPFAKQYVENLGVGELQFLCIVSPPWSVDKEKLL